VPDHPHAGIVALHVIEEMVGKAVEVTSPQPAGIKMEKVRVLGELEKPSLKLGEKILRKCVGDFAIFLHDFVQVCLDPLVKSNSHGIEGLKRVDQR
jgi:hypothetical protein